MRLALAALLPAIAFVLLALGARARFGRRGLTGAALVWLAIAAAVSFATMPPASRQLHSFERSPLPALLGTLAGTAVAFALLNRPSVHSRRAVTGVYSVVGYAVTAVIVGGLTLLALAG